MDLADPPRIGFNIGEMVAKVSRRSLIKTSLGIGSVMLAGEAFGKPDPGRTPEEEKAPHPGELAISVVQFRSIPDLAGNARRHCEHIKRCAGEGARVIVFPECSLPGYFTESIGRASLADLDRSEAEVAQAAREAGVYVIFGGPTKTGALTYNSAVVMSPEGKVIERYHKVHLAGEPWAAPGDHMSVFPIDGTLCSIIICHDERYPELVRLPVMAGARVVFYISHESDITAEEKLEPYRAQIVARAVENSVYIAHANAPADPKDLPHGSHGQSRIISPSGKVLLEAGFFDEEVITATLDLRKASGQLALQSLDCPFLNAWWQEGVAKVKVLRG